MFAVALAFAAAISSPIAPMSVPDAEASACWGDALALREGSGFERMAVFDGENPDSIALSEDGERLAVMRGRSLRFAPLPWLGRTEPEIAVFEIATRRGLGAAKRLGGPIPGAKKQRIWIRGDHVHWLDRPREDAPRRASDGPRTTYVGSLRMGPSAEPTFMALSSADGGDWDATMAGDGLRVIMAGRPASLTTVEFGLDGAPMDSRSEPIPVDEQVMAGLADGFGDSGGLVVLPQFPSTPTALAFRVIRNGAPGPVAFRLDGYAAWPGRMVLLVEGYGLLASWSPSPPAGTDVDRSRLLLLDASGRERATLPSCGRATGEWSILLPALRGRYAVATTQLGYIALVEAATGKIVALARAESRSFGMVAAVAGPPGESGDRVAFGYFLDGGRSRVVVLRITPGEP